MNIRLFGRTIGAQRLKLIIVAMALAIWGFLMPVIYATFSSTFKELFESNPLLRQFTSFGGADIFSIEGTIALAFAHPIPVALYGVFAIGFAAAAVAGERQRGTLEVILARPISRRVLYLTLLIATLLFLAVAIAATLVGVLLGAQVFGVLGEIRIEYFPAVWANAMLLYGALAAIALAASVSFDRLGPALGLTLGVTLVMYFLDVLGSLWPDATWLQTYSLFHYLRPAQVLGGSLPVENVAVLGVTLVVAFLYALITFPRRDLAAPS